MDLICRWSRSSSTSCSCECSASSFLPFRLLAAFDLVLIAYVLGRVSRATWGRWWGLAPVLLLVTLGPGGVTLLWSFQVGYALALAAGVIALLAVQREETRADVLACGMLLLSLASASQGIGFTLGAALMLVLRHGWRRRAWVVVVPAALYALWYLKYGHQYSETHLGLWKGSLTYVMQTLSATLGALVGLSQVTPQTGTLDITFGVPLALATVVAIAYAAWRGWRPGRLFWGAATTFLVLVFATSLSNSNGLRPPTEPRYLPPDAMLLLICLCAGAPRPRLARAGTIATCLVLAIISATNAAQYDQQRTFLHNSDVISRAEIGATDILRGIVPPAFTPEQPNDPGVVINVQAGRLFSAEDAFGPFGYSPATLLRQSEDTRQRADVVLRSGESLGLAPGVNPGASKTSPPAVASGRARTGRGCVIRHRPDSHQNADRHVSDHGCFERPCHRDDGPVRNGLPDRAGLGRPGDHGRRARPGRPGSSGSVADVAERTWWTGLCRGRLRKRGPGGRASRRSGANERRSPDYGRLRYSAA